MKAEEIFRRLTEKFGEYTDSGVLNSNGRDIKEILWEIDKEYLYNQLKDPDTLYIVHHPVSRFNIAIVAQIALVVVVDLPVKAVQIVNLVVVVEIVRQIAARLPAPAQTFNSGI